MPVAATEHQILVRFRGHLILCYLMLEEEFICFSVFPDTGAASLIPCASGFIQSESYTLASFAEVLKSQIGEDGVYRGFPSVN